VACFLSPGRCVGCVLHFAGAGRGAVPPLDRAAGLHLARGAASCALRSQRLLPLLGCCNMQPLFVSIPPPSRATAVSQAAGLALPRWLVVLTAVL
jgi:hypothetical protein